MKQYTLHSTDFDITVQEWLDEVHETETNIHHDVVSNVVEFMAEDFERAGHDINDDAVWAYACSMINTWRYNNPPKCECCQKVVFI